MKNQLACQRAAFSLPGDLHYLNCAYMGPVSRAVQQAGIAGVLRKADPSLIRQADFFTEVEQVRQRFGQLINADAERVAIIPAASYGIATVARNTMVSRGQNVVVSGEQFPSNVYAWRELARRHNIELRTVKRPVTGGSVGEAWNDELLRAVDENTAVVALPVVHWTDGTRFDLHSIGARARQAGAALVVDTSQSLGALPLDQQELRADALIAVSYKWLLGPYTLGAAWYGPRYDNGEPLEESWITRKGSEDFRRLVDYADAYEPGMRRYDMGERSNFALMPMFLQALELILDWQPVRIQEYCGRIAGPAIARAAQLGFAVERAEWRHSHLFGLRMPAGIDLEALQRSLQEQRVFVSLRGSALRVSPNIYNDESDLDALLHVLEQAITSAGNAAARP